MIKNFLIINCIGKNDKIGLKVNESFFIHDLNSKNNNDQIISSILNLIKKHKVNFNSVINEVRKELDQSSLDLYINFLCRHPQE